MTQSYRLALHLFRRDLRLEDNTALIDALMHSDRVIPCFIFDPRQIEKNDYKSHHCIQFMANSLHELNAELKQKKSHLYFFYGIAEEVLENLLTSLPIQAVYINRDYTPFSKMRDEKMRAICVKHHIDFHCFADALLQEPEDVLKPNGQPYTLFTPEFKRSSQLTVSLPKKNTFDRYYQTAIPLEDKHTLNKLLQINNPHLFIKGGRTEALFLLKQIKKLENYKDIRNIPSENGTSKLSAHNKFGTLSIREFYAAVLKYFGPSHTLITELYWRDFFTHIAHHYPHVFTTAFHASYKNIAWKNNGNYFNAWCEGKTGFPIVDAGMRELNTTGYMHNRVRMIVASFLTKDLHIDWRLGEKYFAQRLIDYDPSVNNGNWQWAASTGCDAQPYFRIFNPWLQQQKFDADCLYIKRWIPELAAYPPSIIHGLNKNTTRLMTDYPSPLVDHAIESHKAKMMYKSAKE